MAKECSLRTNEVDTVNIRLTKAAARDKECSLRITKAANEKEEDMTKQL